MTHTQITITTNSNSKENSTSSWVCSLLANSSYRESTTTLGFKRPNYK